MAEKHWQPSVNNKTFVERARMLKNIRAFFDGRNVLEVETPLLSHYATTDPHIDSFRSRFREQTCYLNTSPEYAMKRLLADNPQAIYQICKAFRDDELGSHHNPEFTLLEWYRPNYDMRQLMNELVQLVETIFEYSIIQPNIQPKFEYLSYQKAFEKNLGFNPHKITAKECYQFSLDNKIEIPQGLTANDNVNDWLDWLLTQQVLSAFNKQKFTFLYDYPAAQCSLAKIENNIEQIAVAKRFELFYGDVELANGFFELTDGDEQLQRFQQENQQRKQTGKEAIAIDENLIAALKHGLPNCAGVAVGLDRLLMVLTKAANIEQVLSFSWNRA
ncbi:Translation elongation factor P Lys34--(R)-beta-lysine ligase [hydrothermal vent metagenome]|uniref:Translation elongation factor P Lys34--(R)-beta-lysine ligase n=1 Tax=hydrothermal vent metagenome TaxID=652676 RepID=A0A3B0WFY7_9ZZZZ